MMRNLDSVAASLKNELRGKTMIEKSFSTQDQYSWIRDLVKSEERMEDTGVVDFAFGVDNQKLLQNETVKLLEQLKSDFIEASNIFNQVKNSPLGTIKIYGIARTQADFMLFRNGFKMIFSLRQPGTLSVRFNFISPNSMIPQKPLDASNATGASASSSLMDENLIEAKNGVFGEMMWTYKGQEVKRDAIVKYHMSLFVKESSR
jgi:hypothetical protein